MSNFLAAVSLIALGYWTFEHVRARSYQEDEIRRFANEGQTDEDAASRSKGSAVAMLAIPRLGLAAIVVEGAGESELKLGPGHKGGHRWPSRHFLPSASLHSKA